MCWQQDKVVAGRAGTGMEPDRLTGVLYEERRPPDYPRRRRQQDAHPLSCSHDDPYCIRYDWEPDNGHKGNKFSGIPHDQELHSPISV